MLKIIKKKTAGIILTGILILLLIFHTLILAQILPSHIVWAGNISGNNFFFLELFAISLTMLFIVIGATQSGFFKNKFLEKIARGGTWVMIIYFSANIIGNLLAPSLAEKLIFTPLTIILVLCLIRLVRKDP